MASTAVRSLASAGRARLSGMSTAFLPTTSRITASRLTSSASLGRPGCTARDLSTNATAASASASSSTASSDPADSRAGRPVSLGTVVVLAVAAVTAYQLNKALNDATPVQPNKPGTPGLNPKDWTSLKLKDVQRYNHNSAIYTFALPDANAFLNLPVSSCIMLRYKGADGKDVQRPYTPIDTHRKGEVVLLIKSYDKGNMSKHVAELKPGDTLDFKGPMPKLKYEANKYKRIGMLAGGTGITPMLQVLEEIANNPKDKTQTHLVFANVSGQDILMKETLDAIAAEHSNIKVSQMQTAATLSVHSCSWHALTRAEPLLTPFVSHTAVAVLSVCR